MKHLSLLLATVMISHICLAQIPRTSAYPPTYYDLKSNSQGHAKSFLDDTTPKSKTIEYKVWALTTNFTIPIIRFNFVKSVPGDTSKGNLSFFNSIGAGITLSRGRLKETTDDNGNVINENLNNILGIQVGFLFSASTNGSSNSNIFAPTIGLSILNFEIGYGYELGTLAPNIKRSFLSVAYGIPVSKLIEGGFYLIKKGDVVTNASKKTGFLL